MKVVVLAVAFCISVVNAASCGSDVCARVCTAASCDDFDCGEAKVCNQICYGRTCTDMSCSKENCTQVCEDCKTKMTCTGPFCIQTCKGKDCDMECTSNVETCQQICDVGSTCKFNCNEETTACEPVCNTGATCIGLPEEPKTKTSCDEVTGNCTRTCTGTCKGQTLKCGGGLYKECHLSCEDGCKMECDNTVEQCFQTCIGATPCRSVCNAANCKLGGNLEVSSATVSRLNYLAFGLVAYVVTLNMLTL